MNYDGKVVVITGAASGLGRALAMQLDRSGALLALADVNEEGLKETCSLLKNPNHLPKTLDVSCREDVEQFRDLVLARYNHVDVVINNAGVHVAQRLSDTRLDDFNWVMGVNFWGVVHGSQVFLPSLLGRSDAAIVNISSIYGIAAVPGQGAYNSSKFAIRGFTETLRHELAGTSVHVMCVHPGGIRTNIVRNTRFYVASNMSTDHDAYIRYFDKIARNTPDAAAASILKSLSRRRARCLIGTDARIMDATQRLLPSRYWQVLDTTLYRLARWLGKNS